MNFPLTRRATLALGAALCTGLGSVPAAWAQSPGNPPMRVILPVGPGSGVDTIVRAAQSALSKALNQPVVIENLPGAGGITGTSALVKAAPDGNTIAVISNNHAVNPSVFKKLPYDSLNDLTPISVVGGSPFLLVVNPKLVPAKTAKELQAFLKVKPEEHNYASSGNGTIIHLAGEMVIDAMEVEVRHVPYKGMGPMLTDIMAGQLEMGVASVASVQGQLKSGTLRAIGVLGKSRIASLPDLPTFAEQGFPEVDVMGWFAVVAPAKLPPAQVKRLHEAVVAAFSDPDVMAAMAKQDNVIKPSTPEAARQFLKSEQERYAKIVVKANVKLD
ncbi:tripartite tricarboxylate transporter substrate binding protein [Curvibacter sp. RS43]|uniref:Bug family tripartite tricarboxylate transporter substrate binding protein n=1 Tax=Curvibacter microcysteis TaxID=3026419 RepID=UPI00235EE7AE|nr:tripartite tricarboxylate transporter substrate binding protein [Curvibacter sp. RS43]MDD0811562.1 tripartite tricarboxylate transporter substrate binding protein [Curvibacter sp. RS43]